MSRNCVSNFHVWKRFHASMLHNICNSIDHIIDIHCSNYWSISISNVNLHIHDLTGYDASHKRELKKTKGFGIAFLAYTGFIRLLYTFVSSRWDERNRTIPNSFKCRPATPRQSAWAPLFGLGLRIEREGAQGGRKQSRFHQDID